MEDQRTGPAGCASRMAELAVVWSVKLPLDWQAQAEAFGQELATDPETERHEQGPDRLEAVERLDGGSAPAHLSLFGLFVHSEVRAPGPHHHAGCLCYATARVKLVKCTGVWESGRLPAAVIIARSLWARLNL